MIWKVSTEFYQGESSANPSAVIGDIFLPIFKKDPKEFRVFFTPVKG